MRHCQSCPLRRGSGFTRSASGCGHGACEPFPRTLASCWREARRKDQEAQCDLGNLSSECNGKHAMAHGRGCVMRLSRRGLRNWVTAEYRRQGNLMR